MTLRIGINGFGASDATFSARSRNAFAGIEVAGINDLTDHKTLAHLLKPTRFSDASKAQSRPLKRASRSTAKPSQSAPSAIRQAALGRLGRRIRAETGVFTSREQCAPAWAGAKRVLLTVPPKDEVDAMIVMGVNHNSLKPEHRIISNASCTTNCLAPLAKVLHEKFGIVHGLMTTVHAYTNDQQVLDLPHKDLRRARAAALNIIPTTTGAARAVGKVLPELKGKLDGVALRVPVPDGSVVDLVAEVAKDATVEEINAAYRDAAQTKDMKGILQFSTDPLVSSDIVRNPASTIFDSLSTMVLDKRQVKLIAWYDNEWGYSNRVVELMQLSNQLELPKTASPAPVAGAASGK